MSNKRGLKAFVRYDGSGRVVAGSLILRKNKPKIGKWVEIQTYECCNPPTCKCYTVEISATGVLDPTGIVYINCANEPINTFVGPGQVLNICAQPGSISVYGTEGTITETPGECLGC